MDVLNAINFTNYSNDTGNLSWIDDMIPYSTTPLNKIRVAGNQSLPSPPTWSEMGRIQIPLYATILLLAVIGNSLVILTLVQNRRMRTITNVFLLNLAISDILLGVLCMPITLVGALLKNFVFGETMCKLLPFLQGKYIPVNSHP